MKIKFLLLLPLVLLGCKSNNNDIKTICPTGAPSLLFYDQGNNENVLFQEKANLIIPHFQTSDYDAIVIDATNGLEQIKSHPKIPFRFYKLLTAGNLYLISYKHEIEPNSASTLVSFGNEKSIPHLVTKKLNDTWKIIDGNLDYKNGVQDVLMSAINDTENEKDYFILAEPALTALTTQRNNYKKIWSIKDLFGSDIPQAAIFINKNKVNVMKSYLDNLNARIDNAINKPQIVKDELDKYSEEIFSKFGFASSQIVYKVQNGEGGSSIKNGFAVYDKDNIFNHEKMNEFLNKVNYDETIRYDETYFI